LAEQVDLVGVVSEQGVMNAVAIAGAEPVSVEVVSR
jgi:hypothetical protein